jgi:hypothetical protein
VDHRYLEHVPTIREVDPEAHITLLARNPFLCVPSLIYMGFATDWDEAVNYWVEYNEEALSYTPDRVMLTEDLEVHEGRKVSKAAGPPRKRPRVTYTRDDAAR